MRLTSRNLKVKNGEEKTDRKRVINNTQFLSSKYLVLKYIKNDIILSYGENKRNFKMKKRKGMLNWFYEFLKWDKWHFLAFCGAFLMIFCTKQIAANEAYFYENLTSESRTEFLKTARTLNVSTFMYSYTFKVNCRGKWNGSKFDISAPSKPHVLAKWSSVRDEDKATVIKTINSLC